MKSHATSQKFLVVPFAIFALAGAGPFVSRGAPPGMFHVTREMLCVTEGRIGAAAGQRFSVDVPKMRAYVNRSTPPVIEARFTYLGSTGNEARLGSGELRRQFGVKLRAQDACNLVYAMWRIEPESRLVVSVKSNPGQHTSAECGNRGYRNIKPFRGAPLPPLRAGDSHSLRAEMNGEQLRIFADERVVWEGSVEGEVRGLDGPVGIRSDNAKLDLQLEVGEPSRAQPEAVAACKSGAGEE